MDKIFEQFKEQIDNIEDKVFKQEMKEIYKKL